MFNNAMMPSLVPPERYGRLSGTGWAIGYLGGLVSLVIVLGLLAAEPRDGRAPSSASRRSSVSIPPCARATGSRARSRPSGSWSSSCRCSCSRPTSPRSRLAAGEAVRQGLAQVRTHRGRCAPPRQASGASSSPTWSTRTPSSRCSPSAASTARASSAGRPTELGHLRHPAHDHRHDRSAHRRPARRPLRRKTRDPRAPSRCSASSASAILSLGRDHVLFVIRTAAGGAGRGPLRRQRRKRSSSCLGLVIGAVAGPLQASSRSLLARLVPPGEAGRYFGLLALSGKVTSFLAPADGRAGHDALGHPGGGSGGADRVLRGGRLAASPASGGCDPDPRL